jgi:DNA-binding NtrC family response regulator
MVIMMTAYGTTQTAIEAMKLGAYDYLLKPFDVPRSNNRAQRPQGRARHETGRLLRTAAGIGGLRRGHHRAERGDAEAFSRSSANWRAATPPP